MRIYHSYSSDETKRLGEDVAQILAGRKGRRAALVVALQGDLGAGKTTFVQGFLKGLGIKKRATSPTFVIMRRYKIPHPPSAIRHLFLHHMDAYRLRKPEDVTPLGFEKILNRRLYIFHPNLKDVLDCLGFHFFSPHVSSLLQ